MSDQQETPVYQCLVTMAIFTPQTSADSGHSLAAGYLDVLMCCSQMRCIIVIVNMIFDAS